ncbi:MAG TPA: peptidylprolyl isomerase [Candidatus Paceibacterota bacterium]|nr:peptidylprolyl isomerase [Candidatus Paceibacterota bacterium]
MGSIKHIIGVIGISVLLLGGIGWWVEQNDKTPEILLQENAELQGPFSAEELKTYNPEITNTMNPTAVMKTNRGIIEIELFEDVMPITVGNFVKLSEEGFYNGIKFHRVIDGFMIQAGDPNTKGDDVVTYGTGGPGYTIQDEFIKGDKLTNVRGTIAMANTGQPNSGGSQFFINTVDNTGLDFDKEPLTSKHPVFGRVTKGLDVVDVISATEVGPRDLPVEPVIIESITIVRP